MKFIETTSFTPEIDRYLSLEEFRRFQIYLMENPESGDLIQGSNGLRKIRWHTERQGKRGGLRIIYYFTSKSDLIYLLFAYRKSKQSDLTYEQKKMLIDVVREELQNA